MRKKIVNVLLSVAIVTSMMFTVTACGKVTLEEWTTSKEAVTTIETMNQSYASQGMSAAFEADGDVLSMVLTLEDTIEVSEETQAAMGQALDSQSSVFEAMRDELVKKTGNENVVLRIVYMNGDGTEIYTHEF